MITEPKIDINEIKSAISENWGLVVGDLRFNPGGEASWGYVVTAQSGKKYFYKIHTGLYDAEVRFELIYRLFKVGGIQNITHPLVGKNNTLLFPLHNFQTALFNFISGLNTHEKEMTDIQRFDLGVLLGKIHSAKDVIGDFSLREDFLYYNTSRLINSIEKAKNLLHDKSRFKSQTATLLLDHSELIQVNIKNLMQLGEELRKQNLEFVICHGEPHKWNTMIDDNGEVYLIDWDDSLFAPKEKDLYMIKDDQVKLVGYKSIVGDFEINKEVIRYYSLEWTISSIDHWVISIFNDDVNDIQNQHFIDELSYDLSQLER